MAQAIGRQSRLTAEERQRVNRWLARLPYYRQGVRVVAGEGLKDMHAASFVPQRRIVLDRRLLRRQRELARILYHEIFHFVWFRLGNPLRQSYGRLLRREWAEGARGELGWSAEGRKRVLRRGPARFRGRRWAEYVCESFCDSAAWFVLDAGGRAEHEEWTLKPRFRQRRAQWFRTSDLLPRLRL